MRYLIPLLTIFLLSACTEPEYKKPKPCTKQKCIFPTLPTYKTPLSRKIEKPKIIDNGYCVMKVDDLLELSRNNKKLRNICWKYASVNIRVNKKYEKDNK